MDDVSDRPAILAEDLPIAPKDAALGVISLTEVTVGIAVMLVAEFYDQITVVGTSLLMKGNGPHSARERNRAFIRRHVLHVRELRLQRQSKLCERRQ